MIYYVCKYTPVELLQAFGAQTAVLDRMAENFDLSDAASHVNLCGFGKAVLEAVLEGGVDQLVLVNCCDVMRRVYDVLKQKNCCRFLYLLDLPHTHEVCQIRRFARELARLQEAYARFSGKSFDRERFLCSFATKVQEEEPYVALLGARVGSETQALVESCCPLPVRNLTCVGNRVVDSPKDEGGEGALMEQYAAALLRQVPCRRMVAGSARRALWEDPALQGVIYHTIQFCDYYGLEYREIKNQCSVPLTKIETDFTMQSSGQLKTRVEAFMETLHGGRETKGEKGMYFAGIDSGSTSTDAVIVDRKGRMIGSSILPTGGGAQRSANAALDKALEDAGLQREQIDRVVTTGYGRAHISEGDENITEITCHAKGAHFLWPKARTIIDIGGQDSKVIHMDEGGKVLNFAMNDKCAAGTGRFLEMMARTLGLTMEEMSQKGLEWEENIAISSMCTVFAESEVVSLVAQNKAVEDIIHGLNQAVAAKTSALISRVGGEEGYMITGGVAQNRGVVQAIEERIGGELYVCQEAQLCGAWGAALFAAGL